MTQRLRIDESYRCTWAYGDIIFCPTGTTFEVGGGRSSRGATMVAAERENFKNLGSLDRRKWHFQGVILYPFRYVIRVRSEILELWN